MVTNRNSCCRYTCMQWVMRKANQVWHSTTLVVVRFPEFICQHLLQTKKCKTLIQLEDERNIVLAILKDIAQETAAKLILAMREPAPENRDLVFGYVSVVQFEEFADKKTKS
ncbi:unnamed protein product [Arabis nemorensis]|uniref:Uncharacterized protein n=1 Tax=Arabis nemorensis TaxID=586526 RepID=A0A565C4V0_9BRAS|nr:unnamed protein product [Arabis nemorensis]